MYGIIHDETFKMFGLSDKTDFTQEEYQTLLQQYAGIHELRNKLEKYNQLKSKPPRLPIDYSQRIAELTAQKTDLQNRIATLQQQLTDVDNLLTQLGTPTDTTQQLLVSIATQNKTMLQEKLDDLSSKLTEVENEITRLQQQEQADQDRYASELNVYNTELDNLKTAILALAQQLGVSVAI